MYLAFLHVTFLLRLSKFILKSIEISFCPLNLIVHSNIANSWETPLLGVLWSIKELLVLQIE